MRFSNWYSISIFLIFATFVATIGAFFIRGNNICLFCLVSKKASDCEQFKKIVVATAQLADFSPSEELEIKKLSGLQFFQASLNTMADGHEKRLSSGSRSQCKSQSQNKSKVLL